MEEFQEVLTTVLESNQYNTALYYVNNFRKHYIDENPYFILSFVFFVFIQIIMFQQGLRKGRREALISKDLKRQFSQADLQKVALEKRQIQLQARLKKFNKIIWIFWILISIILAICIYYYDLIQTQNLYFELQITGLTLLAIAIIIYTSRQYLIWRQKGIKETLIHFNLEKGQIAMKIVEALGQKLTEILRVYFLQQNKQFNDQKYAELKATLDEKTQTFQIQVNNMKRKIDELENTNRSLMIQLRQAKDANVSNHTNNQKDAYIQKMWELQNEETHILKGFITKITHFNWSEECLELTLDKVKNDDQEKKLTSQEQKNILECVAQYMSFSRETGSAFNEDIKNWKQKFEDFYRDQEIQQHKNNNKL